MTAREAFNVGLRRHDAARRRGAGHRRLWQPSADLAKRYDGMSAVSEWLVAEALGQPWLSTGDLPDHPEDGDVGGGIAVRWTRLSEGSLIIYPDDSNRLIAVLVVNERWPLRIAGWIPVAAAKQDRWWRTNVRSPAFFVPQRALDSDIETLKELLRGEEEEDAGRDRPREHGGGDGAR